METRIERQVPGFLAWVLALELVLNLVFVTGLVMRGNDTQRALQATAPGFALGLLGPSRFDDSWAPMLTALNRRREHPDEGLYAAFFEDGVKFQYPPSSLLLFALLPRSVTEMPGGEVNSSLRRVLGTLSQAAVALTVLAAAFTLLVGLRRPGRYNPQRIHSGACFLLFACLGLTFYPVVKAHDLGQIQAFLTAAIAVGFLAYRLGRTRVAGLLFGACCLVKPQFGVVLLWSLLRRNHRFTLGMLAALIVGLLASLWQFGLYDHLRYLDVMQTIARHGESYWPNQSVNGVLHRLLESGDAVRFSFDSFAPYDPVVYVTTLITSIVLLGVALWPLGGRKRVACGVIDLAVVTAAATLASPVAWDHHHGLFLPILAVGLPGLLRTRPIGRATAGILALAFLAMGNVLLRPYYLFSKPWLGLLGSHLFFGSLTVFVLLVALRARAGEGPCDVPSVRPS